MRGIKFGEIHTGNDLDFVLSKKEIGFPSPKTHVIEIPGRDGDLDLTEAFESVVRYNNRTLSFEFSIVNDKSRSLLSRANDLIRAIHGKKITIIDDDDKSHYFIGRCTVGTPTRVNSQVVSLIVTCDCEPYRKELYSSSEPWLWDTFDFEEGVINSLYDLVVKGSLSVVLIGGQQRIAPVITSDSSMVLTVGDKSYNLMAGKNIIDDLIIEYGDNTLLFTGNGKITIDYRGGIL